MANLLVPVIEKYLSAVLPARDPVLADMEAYARKHDVPIIGPECGRLLYLLTQISGAKRIFEMGSAIGYSAIWFARAGGPDAEIYFTDGDSQNAVLAGENFKKAGLTDQIRILTGDALDLLDSIAGDFDIILIDVNKHQYPDALRKSIPRLKHGGLLITDNVLWSGKVTKTPKDEATRGIVEFNKRVYASEVLFPVIVPLRDGVAVCRKT